MSNNTGLVSASPQSIAINNNQMNLANNSFSQNQQGQWQQQNKLQNQTSALPVNLATSTSSYSSNPNNQPNPINSYLTSNNQNGSPYTQSTNFTILNGAPLSLSDPQSILAKYGLQSQNLKSTSEFNSGSQYTSSSAIPQNQQQQNTQLQNYMSSSQNGLASGSSNNVQSNINNYQSQQNQNYMNSSSNSNNNQTSLQNSTFITNNLNNNLGSPSQAPLLAAGAGSNSSSQTNLHTLQHQQQQSQQAQQQNSSNNPGSSNSLNYISNFHSTVNSQSNIAPISNIQPNNNQSSTNSNIINNSSINNNNVSNQNNSQSIGSATIKVKNLIRSSQELKEKVIENEKLKVDEKDNKNFLQDKSPITLGQQIFETLKAQQQQYQQQPQQNQGQIQSQLQSQQGQQPTLQQQYYSQNPSFNYSSLSNQISNINNINHSNNNNNNNAPNNTSNNNLNQSTEQGQSSINSARFSAQNYLQTINNAANQSNLYAPQNSQTRNSGIRNHTLERTDNIRSGNLNTKVQNSFQFNKGNNGLNTSSGATSQASGNSNNNNNNNNNLFRKSLEYNQTSQLSGLSSQNATNNSHVHSTTINLYSSPQMNPISNLNNSTQANMSRSSNLKPTSNNFNIYTKDNNLPNEQQQTATETRFLDFYNKTKSPRDQVQALQKFQTKEKPYNITDYEALNQQNQLQQQQAGSNQSRMSTSQHNQQNQSQQGSFQNIVFNKSHDSQSNIQGIIATGIEMSSRSLERKVQPSSSKYNSSTNIISKIMSGYNPKQSITGILSQQQQQVQQGDQTLEQKYSSNSINNQNRAAHHQQTISSTSKNAKSSRSNTPSKSGTSSNYISPSPSFLGLAGGQQQQKQQQGSQTHIQAPNKLQQEYNSIKNQNNSYKQGESQQQYNKQNTINSQSNHYNTSLAGQIISVNNNPTDFTSKQSPKSSLSQQSQTQKLAQISSLISSLNQNQINPIVHNPHSTTSPKLYLNQKDRNHSFSKTSIHQDEKPKSQTTISPQTEKVSSNQQIESKSLASRYNQEALQHYLDNQNSRIPSNTQIPQPAQEEKRSTSMNKLQSQYTNSASQNINVYSQLNNNLFISSDFEENHQLNYNNNSNNAQSKSKSPVNQQKSLISKPFDFSQFNSSNLQNKQQPQQQQPQQLGGTFQSKTPNKHLTLSTEETNLSSNQQGVSSTKNKQLQNKFQQDISITQSPLIGNANIKQNINEDQFLNYQQINSQYYTSNQSHTRTSIAAGGGANTIMSGSPHSQNLSNKSFDRIGTKKPTNSTMRLFSEKKNAQNMFNTKSPKSTNNNSFQQGLHHLASATSSMTNDNSITHSSIKRFDGLDQQSGSTAIINSSPFTKKQIDEHSTPTHPHYSGEGGNKSYNSQLSEVPFFINQPSNNIYKNSPSPQNSHLLEMIKIKDKMKKILETHTSKEKVLQSENHDLKNQIQQLKQQINSQQSEISLLKSQLPSSSITTTNHNNTFNYSNNNQLQMSFQNLFINPQDYSAQKGQLSPRQSQSESHQIFQSPLEISFQQHQ